MDSETETERERQRIQVINNLINIDLTSSNMSNMFNTMIEAKLYINRIMISLNRDLSIYFNDNFGGPRNAAKVFILVYLGERGYIVRARRNADISFNKRLLCQCSELIKLTLMNYMAFILPRFSNNDTVNRDRFETNINNFLTQLGQYERENDCPENQDEIPKTRNYKLNLFQDLPDPYDPNSGSAAAGGKPRKPRKSGKKQKAKKLRKSKKYSKK